LGLVIHAAADGLALGVANLSRNRDGNPNPVSFIVFLALILHKGDSSVHAFLFR
jgi:zinc transporter 9